MAILIFAVKHHAGGLAAHTGIKALHSFGLYIYIIAVIKGKCQRIFIVFAPVHQSVHFFGGHGVGIQALPQPGFHLRTVGTDKIIRLHTAQQLRGQRPAAAPRGHSQLYACRLHGVQGIGHRAGDSLLPGRANRAVKIKNQQLILHVLCSLSRYFFALFYIPSSISTRPVAAPMPHKSTVIIRFCFQLGLARHKTARPTPAPEQRPATIEAKPMAPV